MKTSKGTPIKEWLREGKMTESEVTTARVFLILGAILGLLVGLCLGGLYITTKLL